MSQVKIELHIDEMYKAQSVLSISHKGGGMSLSFLDADDLAELLRQGTIALSKMDVPTIGAADGRK